MATASQRPFALRLRATRQAAKLSQQQLAERSGVSARTISDLERGVWHAPRADTASLLANALGLTGDERDVFLGVVEEQRQPKRPPSWNAPPLPPEEQTLVGREALLAEVGALLAPGALLTLVGPGGVGKTRLALALAHQTARDGRPIAWVPLASVVDPAEVLPAVARAAGVVERPDTPLRDRLVAVVRDRGALLVLDNLEHLLEAAGEIAALRAAIPDLAVLVTSRLPAHVRSERRVTVPPLALPPASAPSAEIAGAPAVRLFLDRAAERGHDLPPTGDELRAAAEVVGLVDGLPLAIEFAAARTDSLSYAAVGTLLRHTGLRLLEGGPPEAHPRLRSMERAVAWSHDLLDPAAQRLFRLLSVFRGGFSVDDLAAVAAAIGDPDLVVELPGLERASLVRQLPTADGAPARFGMLEPTRIFAADRLRQAGIAERALDAHAAIFATLAEAAAADVLGPRFAAGLAVLDAERANLAAALSHAIDRGNAPVAARIAASLLWWWELRAEISEGRRWLERVAALDGLADAALRDRVTVLWGAALLAGYQEDRPAMARRNAALAALAEETGSPLARGLALAAEGEAMVRDGPGDRRPLARFDAAVALLDPLGPSLELAYTLGRRSMEQSLNGDTEAALADIARSIAMWQAIGTVVFRAVPHHHHGAILLGLDRPEEARAAYRAALDIAEQTGGATVTALVLSAIAALAVGEGDDGARRAARLLGAADRLIEQHDVVFGAVLDERNATTRRGAAERLGDAAVDALVAEGREMPTAEAVALARGC